MKQNLRGRKAIKSKDSLHGIRLNLAAFAALVLLAATGILMVRLSLLKNAQETGQALARSYAAEEHSCLSAYKTLLSFGTASVEQRIDGGETEQELLAWANLYFSRLNTVLGSGVVDPYLVINGKILAANPWAGDETYDVYAAQWYQAAAAAAGEVVFTNVYTDAITGRDVITAAQMCRNANAVLAFDIFPERLRFQTGSLELKQGDSFFLCDSAGALIYKQTDLTYPAGELQAYLHNVIIQIKSGSFERYDSYITDLSGSRRAVYYTRMDNGWFSIVTVPYANILGNLNWFFLFFLLIIGLFSLALAGVAWREKKYNARIKRTNETVQVLGNSYYALYRVDFGQNTYEMIKGSDYVRNRIPPTGPYDRLLRTVGEIIEADAYKEFAETFSIDNIRRLVARRVRDFGGDFLRRFGEEYRWVSVRILFDESLAPGEVVLCFREVEQEKQAQLRQRKLLQDALEMARQNEAAKQSFFRNMSHDMRTPLNAIIGLSQLAEQSAGDPQKTAGYLKKIKISSRQLLGLINDILDMSRLEQGKVMLNNRQFHLSNCIEECAAPFRIQAQSENKTLTTQLTIENNLVLGDPFRIQQILNNLLSNALKFTNRGGCISLSVHQIESEGEFAKYKFIIADTGIGMSEDFLPHLFEPYSREMRFREKQTVGTGLGMPITKSLVAQMNGEISVQSAPGRGSCFTIILPFPVAQEANGSTGQQDRQNPAAPPLIGRHILLAEDNTVNRERASELLSIHGLQVTPASNGAQALQLFAQSPPFTFDAVLMDVQMPEMDGCEATRRIRALRRPDAGLVPIIAVTANAFAEDIAATIAAGMNAHIAKPLDMDELLRLLQKFLKQ